MYPLLQRCCVQQFIRELFSEVGDCDMTRFGCLNRCDIIGSVPLFERTWLESSCRNGGERSGSWLCFVAVCMLTNKVWLSVSNSLIVNESKYFNFNVCSMQNNTKIHNISQQFHNIHNNVCNKGETGKPNSASKARSQEVSVIEQSLPRRSVKEILSTSFKPPMRKEDFSRCHGFWTALAWAYLSLFQVTQIVTWKSEDYDSLQRSMIAYDGFCERSHHCDKEDHKLCKRR